MQLLSVSVILKVEGDAGMFWFEHDWLEVHYIHGLFAVTIFSELGMEEKILDFAAQISPWHSRFSQLRSATCGRGV